MPDIAGDIVRAWQRELPGTPTDSIEIITRIWRAGKLLDDERRRTLAALGIDRATMDLLSMLRRAGEPYRLTPAELAAQSLVSAGAMTQRVARAESAGLVSVHRNPAGTRTIDVRLTAEGHRWIDVSVADLLTHESTLVEHLSAKQRVQLAELLEVFLRGLHAHLDAPGNP
ncbi:MarR family transcriptional regulator [Tsukamurella tyrosinosolvens]|uniref:MarR family winged helix-turn-helix transcriptional regulator n=1 Tax=Tsukamurella tyrosinosolvens TaxID=57704 RepID=UPI000791922B|nr:MarR family transcriptional regulator [Tsukamurella tyrosinosolvens]KXP06364.1 MarR family transcriptional regulator [Tsukamurella tyrosinosolvens]KZL96165.1 MarR family transcriptional regulator [Tsukamurella tyrosinosolvens]MCA4993244.1 MarR family transcriptional regulator [Tsukamurella tyrosinosolvens]